MADNTDALHALKHRQRGAWADVYERYADDVFRFIAHLLHGDQSTAEEIHQETWLSALAGIDGYEEQRGPLRAWIFGIARRHVALHFRRGGRIAGLAGDDALESLDDGSILPVDLLSSIERGDAVRAALAELEPDSRHALEGKYLHGLSVAELAQQLNRSPKAAESLLWRGRERMRRLLRWYLDNDPVREDPKS